MGSNMSPTVAGIVMNELLDTVIPKLGFRSKLFLKYVDDLLAVIPRRQLQQTLRALNSYHERIQFTMETENEGKLPYLDLLLIRDVNNLITNWYQKETAAKKALNFLSNHSLQMEKNVAYNMLYRATTLSNEEFHDENIEKVKGIFRDSNYPERIIRQQIQKAENRRTNGQNIGTQNVSTEQVIRRSLTYDGHISNVISRELMTRSNGKLNVLAKPNQSLQQTVFSKLKTVIPTLERTNVVYEIPCEGKRGENCGLNYVGQTKNPLKKRLDQHKRDLELLKPDNGQSAIVHHFEECGHYPTFVKTKVLGSETWYRIRNTLEIFNICSRATINMRRDTEGMAASYVALLDDKRCNFSINRDSHAIRAIQVSNNSEEDTFTSSRLIHIYLLFILNIDR